MLFDKRSWFCDKYCQSNMKPNEDEQSPLEVSTKIGKFLFVCCVDGYLTNHTSASLFLYVWTRTQILCEFPVRY